MIRKLASGQFRLYSRKTDPKTGKPTRVRFEVRGDKKVRVAAKSGELIHG